MRPTQLRSFLVISVALHASMFGAPAVDRDKLIDELFKPAEIGNVQVSPGGATIAYHGFYNRHRTLSTLDVATMKQIGSITGTIQGEDVGYYSWADADHLVYQLTAFKQWGKAIISANRSLTSRLLLLPDHWSMIYDATPFVKGEILVSWRSSDALYEDIMRLDITGPGDFVSVAARNPGDFVGWGADMEGVIRIGCKQRTDGYSDAYHRWTEKEEWQKLPLPERARVQEFSASGDSVLVQYPAVDERTVLQAFDLKAGKLIGQPMSDPVYDIAGGSVVDLRTRQLIAYTYEADRPKTIWFDADFGKLFKAVRAKAPGLTHSFIDFISTGELLIESRSDVQPSFYWLLNMETMAARPFKKSMPWIEPEKMRPMEPVHFAARDGAVIHGYLTKPATTSTIPPPLLLIIHGGPRTRDKWGFNEEVQFFSALGYSVLQVNYRGSSGFGGKYELSSALDVARVSVDDVADAVKWAIGAGLADPKRVAIYGASYGGYIALASATRYPDMYRCAMGFAGVYDWEMQYRRTTKDYDSSFWDWQALRYGDAKKSPEKFHAYSPVNFASAIKCPIWLGHGGADVVVYSEQTKAMASALKKAGRPVEFVTDSWGIHGFQDPEKCRAFYRALSDFLLKNLPVE
jgi:dipeptidyl aminopeptidase/acylaminoacyl peptidase